MDSNFSKTGRSSSPQTEYALIISGWLASRIGLSTIRGHDICGLALLPAIPILIYNVLLLIRTAYRWQPRNRTFCLLSGLLSDAIPYWILRHGSESRYEIISPWDSRLWAVSLVFLVVVSGLWWIFRNMRIPRLFSSLRYGIISTILISVPIIVVTIFRIHYSIMQHLPNEERSLFLVGSEIHHAYIGALCIILCNALTRRLDSNLMYYFSFLLSISIGLIIDQITYVMMFHVSDAAYSSTLSWIGPIVGLCLIIVTICWYHSHTTRPSQAHDQSVR